MGQAPDTHCPLEEVFTPGAPVRDPSRYLGRERQLASASAALSEPGRHLLIPGEPGVGRTSFALAAVSQRPFRYHAVGLDDTFQRVLVRLLDADLPAEGRPGSDPADRESISPWHLIDAPLPAEPASVIVMDDLDRASGVSLSECVLPLLRALSDSGASTKLVLTLRRDRPFPAVLSGAGLRLHAIALDRMDEASLRAIIDRGGTLTGLRFAPPLRDRIVQDADGLPGVVHSLCLGAARAARARGSRTANLGRDYLPALEGLVSSLGPGLEAKYEEATSARSRVNRYEHLLWAAALSPDSCFDMSSLEAGLERIEGRPVAPQAFAVHLGDLLKREILTRLREGQYRFKDPAMRAYVRLLLRRDRPALMGDDPLQLALPY